MFVPVDLISKCGVALLLMLKSSLHLAYIPLMKNIFKKQSEADYGM